VEEALNDITSKFGLLVLFQPAGYDTTISLPFTKAVAPAIELAGPDAVTPVSRIIRSSVIGPFPFALKRYKYDTISPATAWFGCMYAYAAGVDVEVVVTVSVGVKVDVNVCVNVAVNVDDNVHVSVGVNVDVSVCVRVGVNVDDNVHV
jgi:hypothetical protein